jgi:F-type H+-transporting ATPase subunit delta
MSVARPYARALYAAAREASAADAVLADLEATADLLTGTPDLAAFLKHPAVAAERKHAVLRQALAGRVGGLTLRFLLLLIDKRRFDAFPDIVRAFRGLVEAAQGIGRGRVETARPMTEQELAALEDAASRWLGGRVRLQADVRPELIGGARIIVGDRVIDGSLVGRIQRLGRQLQA